MKKLLVLFLAAILAVNTTKADEGMWLLPLLGKANYAEMKSAGLKIQLKDIYNPDGNSLTDAIVIFGAGCTGEIVSSDGLLFTNHHCGYDAIQSLSSVDHDYLKNGFWAMNRAEELPAPGLSVKFIRKMEDLTDRVLAGTTVSTPDAERGRIISTNMAALSEEYQNLYPYYSVMIQSFFGGNQYFMFAIEEYNDVRLVGAPPTSIGKFGGDTDNWMWPRHTGDFSVFRVYSAPDGTPAEYSKDNVPYHTPVHLKVSMKGYKEGDFAMIMGFPGSTSRYMTSYEIDETLNISNPNRIFIRGVRQDILTEDMNASDQVRIQYASKYARSSNYWKNSIGMSRGLKKLDVRTKKQAQEDAFRTWVASNPNGSNYSSALDLIEQAVKGRAKTSSVNQYISEALLNSVEILTASSLAQFLNSEVAESEDARKAVLDIAESFYKDYNESTDRKVAKAMFRIIADSLPASEQPQIFPQVFAADFNNDMNAVVDYIYDNSIFANFDKFSSFLNAGNYADASSDPAYIMRESVMETYRKNQGVLQNYNTKFREGHRLYIAGLMEMEKNKLHYPDANFTMRLTYGNILPYSPADAVEYNYYTTLTGVMEKEDPTSTEFTVDPKLKELYNSKDFGPYAWNGDVQVGFLSTNDITGGNSGSPVLNGRGELLGLAFDGNWEAMSGDIAFEPDLQRTINVDVRYVLFIIDKFAGAGYLLDEMTIVR